MAEQWHPVRALAARFSFSPKHIRNLIRSGAFGDTVLVSSTDIRVPESGVQLYIRTNTRRVVCRARSLLVEGVSR